MLVQVFACAQVTEVLIWAIFVLKRRETNVSHKGAKNFNETNFTLLYTFWNWRTENRDQKSEKAVSAFRDFTILYMQRGFSVHCSQRISSSNWKPNILAEFSFVHICAVDFACTNLRNYNVFKAGQGADVTGYSFGWCCSGKSVDFNDLSSAWRG